MLPSVLLSVLLAPGPQAQNPHRGRELTYWELEDKEEEVRGERGRGEG